MKPLIITSVACLALGVLLVIGSVASGLMVLLEWQPDSTAIFPVLTIGELVPATLLLGAGSTFITLAVLGAFLALHAHAITSTMRILDAGRRV